MNQNPAQVRVQLITPVLIITVLMLIAWTLTQWKILGEVIGEERSRFTSLMVQEWQTVVSNKSNTQENLLHQISKNNDLRDHLASRDRAATLDIMQPLLNYYRKTSGISLFYLHTPEGVNFARAHQPELYGDRIPRETLRRAMASGQAVSGIEISQQGNTTLRTVQPWFRGDELVGYLEMGTRMQSLVSMVRRHQHVDITLILNKSLINKEKWLQQNPQRSESSWNQFHTYLVEATTRNPDSLRLAAYFDIRGPGKTSWLPQLDSAALSKVRSRITVYDISNEPIGFLLVDKDFSWLVEEFSGVIRNILSLFAVLIAITCFIYAYFAKRVNDQFSFQYRALHSEIESRKVAEHTLKEHQKNLEEEVAKRTRELNLANRQLKEDIELRETTERQLAESTQKYRALFNGSTDMILVLRDNRIMDANVAAHSALEFGHFKTNSLTSLDDILKYQGQSTATQWLRHAREEGVFRAEMDFHGREQIFPVDVMITYINEDESDLFLLACRDISERKAAQAKVEYQALYDPLTDLPNRRLFMEELQRATQLCRRQNNKGAILFIDLDHFKNINDTLGHSIGDELLEVVARRLKSCMRAEDTVARFGGDEFVVILPCCGDDNDEAAQSALATAHKIRETLAETFELGEHQLHVTPSVGIAIFPKLNETTEDILKQADAALYGAKGDGRNTVRFFEPRMQKANEERLILEKELRK
ncbi:MAG: diguanylate cyclase, partial [Ketobacteraceae bacterium]|nr:diguanylate cyclase [Ketobacteraceae bacterium]